MKNKVNMQNAVRGARVAAQLGNQFWDEVEQHLIDSGHLPPREQAEQPEPEVSPLVSKRHIREGR
jgi:hypothetical protein